MTILNTLKQLTPLSARRFLKARLPAGLVRFVATSPISPLGVTGSGRKALGAKGRPVMEGPVCPICGSALGSAQNQKGVICTGCGSSSHDRRLALAVYANAQASTMHILVLNPSQPMKAIFSGRDGVFFADSLSQIPADLSGSFDLCIHSHWPHGSGFGPERILREIDARLAPKGVQIFTIKASAGAWPLARWRVNDQAMLQWLRRKGWAEPTLFEPSEFYGEGAEVAFGCSSAENTAESITVLQKL